MLCSHFPQREECRAPGLEHAQGGKAQPLRLQLLPWAPRQSATSGQARPGLLLIPWWAGIQPGRQGRVWPRQGFANKAPEPSHSSQGQSQGEQRPWSELGPGAARQAAPRQLTGRTEPARRWRGHLRARDKRSQTAAMPGAGFQPQQTRPDLIIPD